MNDCKKCIHFKVCQKAEKIENYKLNGECSEFLDADRVIVLPCKMGDKVYVIPSETNFRLNVLKGFEHLNKVYEQTVDEIRIYESGDYLLFTCDKLQCVHSKMYKENWFLSREDAEQALSKLQASYEQVKGGAE